MTAGSERVGVIVVRAWIEGSPGSLRARITHSDDVGALPQTSELAAGTEQILARVREWIEAFAAQDR